MTIRKKMIQILLACTIIPMCFVSILGYYHARKSLESLRMEELISIADLKAKRIEDFFSDQHKNIMIAQHHLAKKNYSAIFEKFSGNPNNQVHETIKEELDRFLMIFKHIYDFRNIIMTNSEGRIVYSLDRSSNVDLFEQTISNLRGKFGADVKNRIQLSDIFTSKTESGRFSIFFLTAIRSEEGEFLGLAAFEADMGPIYELIQNTTGLGKTGETLIAKKVRNYALYLNPLRHDQNAALNRKVFFGGLQAVPIQKALKGNSGCGISVDYRGKEVIAAWRYIPSLGWGMVAKIDTKEAFKSNVDLRNFILIIVIALIILNINIAFTVAKSISDPIYTLQVGAEAIGKGNLDHKVATDEKDEIGQLGRAFDKMTEQLKTVTASRDELDKEIKERRKVEKELQESMNIVGERIKELNCFFEISRLVEQRGLNLMEILQKIVEIIPPAYQHPEITCARMIIEDQEFSSDNFKETQWSLTQNIIVNDKALGTLTVNYIDDISRIDEDPFFKEEKDLLKAIAERIGRIIERNRAQNALVESEKRFRDLVELSLTGISIIQNGQIVYQNSEQERLLGPLPRPIKLKDTESIHRDDVIKVKTFYKNIEAGKLPIGSIDFRFYHPSKNNKKSDMKWVHCQASMIEYQGKDAILVNMMNMTKAKELEHLLTIQDKMASLGRVAAGIAHEIRNPLSGINIYLKTLKKFHHQEGSEEKVEQILLQVQSASNKIESVIRRVMDFAKPSEPKLALTDINQPISDATKLTAVTYRKSGINLEEALEDDLPQTYVDSNLIEEVVLNLLNNAAEAMKSMEKGKKIIVWSAVEEDCIIIRISDSGPGVPLEIRDKIFDPYFTTKSDGTGIGLSLSHRFITDHGGSLTVSDSDLGGAEFRIEIPIKKPIINSID